MEQKSRKIHYQPLYIVTTLVLLYTFKLGKCNNTPDQFKKLRENWRSLLVTDTYDQSNNAVVQYVSVLSDEAEKLNRTLIRSPNKQYLWPKESISLSAHFTTQFGKMLKLTLAYGTNGTRFYQDPDVYSTITEGLNFLFEKGYDGTKYVDNWWDWQIGVPQHFIKILMVLSEELQPTEMKKYTKAISGYIPNPYKQMTHGQNPRESKLSPVQFTNQQTVSTNRADIALSVLGLGVLQNDSSKIHEAFSSILDLFRPVTSGDGFYSDGSFLQHGGLPYAGNYGSNLLQAICQCMAVIKDTRYEMNATFVEFVVGNVKKAFIPLIYKGKMTAIVNGRVISRAVTDRKIGYGEIVLYNLLFAAKIAPQKSCKEIKEAVKYYMRENPAYHIINARDYNEFSMTISLLNDKSIKGEKIPFIGTKMYASMDRFVQRTNSYMVALAMYSSRISAFEAGNGENKKGWHTADGMMYLYNDDQVQFNESYWPTVDPYRLPGTTVDTVPLIDETRQWLKYMSSEKWVGGATDNAKAAAVVGMSLDKRGTYGTNLRAKKSWFFVDGLIVALGAGITGKTTATIETIVDNRLLNDEYNYQVLSNNVNSTITAAFEESEKEWLLLQANQNHRHASIGYYFPNKETIMVIKEQRNGKYSNINDLFSTDQVFTGNYAKFIINHGKQPENASYAYVILPGANKSNLNEFAIKKPIIILRNTIDVQAIKLTTRTLNYLGVNIWKGTGGGVDGIWVNKPVSLIKLTRGNRVTYTISDPTQSSDVVTVKLPRESRLVRIKSNEVEVVGKDKYNFIFNVNFNNARGSSKKIILIKRLQNVLRSK